MAKVSPAVRSFNAGVFSKLMEGRTDAERYPASMQEMHNYVAAPQGPAIARSGTSFKAEAYGEISRIVPFIFSDDQALQVEVSTDRIRLHTEDGAVIRNEAPITPLLAEPFSFEAPAGFNAAVGEEVAVRAVDPSRNLNGVTFKIVAKNGEEYTTDGAIDSDDVGMYAARVYHVPANFAPEDLAALRYIQKVDIVYLLFGTRPVMKLSRYGTYDWRLEEIDFEDGPYLPINEEVTTLQPSGDGNAVPDMKANAQGGYGATADSSRPAQNGGDWLGRYITYPMAATQPYMAFDDNPDSLWAGTLRQRGYIQIRFPAPKVIDGYSIYVGLENPDPTFISTDYAPSDWYIDASNDGVNYQRIDVKRNYVLYEKGKSAFFEIKDPKPFTFYRMLVFKLMKNGSIEPRIGRWVLREKDNAGFNLTASGVKGINRDQGFLPTDVGRLIRLRADDGAWRSVKITAVANALTVSVKLLGEPLPNLAVIREWRLGAWSYTTGFPTIGDFHDDRLFLASTRENPDLLAGSVVGKYETFSPTDDFGAVLDESGVVLRPNSKKLSRVRWMAADEKGLLFGSGSQEFVLTTSDGGALTARNPKIVQSTSRGSANVEPAKVDRQVLFVQRSGRNVREMAYVYEADGYKSPSMSQLASHLGVKRFVQIEYAQEPYGIAWIRREDGSVVGLTYNRDESVVGWHTHDFSGAYIEDIAVLPTADQLQDALWIIARREVNGQQKRYIEKLERFWDFDMTIHDAHFVDCGLRYIGEPTDIIYGLTHLEGREVYGLADTRPVGPYTVVNGSVELEFAASNVVLGLGFDASAITSRLENGATDGTAQGKVKRINSLVALLWASAGGQIGVYSDQENGIVYDEVLYPGDNSEIEELELYSDFTAPLTPAPGYEMNGVVAFRRPANSPLPFNIVALMPQMNTQDR